MPSLKMSVDKMFQSRVVYKIECSRCKACYVGQTIRHLKTRIGEHQRPTSPVGVHMRSCETEILSENVTILEKSNKSVDHLLTLEALWIRDLKPSINTKDEYRSHILTIKI